MSGGIDEYIKTAYSDRLKKITALEAKPHIFVYQINTSEGGKKEILKILLKKCFASSCLSVFKKNIEIINSKCIENENVIKSNILYESSNYLLISRFKSNNKFEKMNEKDLKEYFEENGSYLLLTMVIKVLKIFHSNNLYHGGIKLSNIMINSDSVNDNDKYEICDYFYSILNEREIEICNRNVNYLSPEELLNKEIGVGKDMWNIGILLYKILSGKFPFEAEKLLETELNILYVKYNDLKVEFSDLLNPLIHKLLLKESENRISIFEFEKEIDKINSNQYFIVKIIPFVKDEVKFTSKYKHKYIKMSEDSKLITKSVSYDSHCYLNVQMSEDIHHFIFKIAVGNNAIYFGCTSNKKYDGNSLFNDKSVCSIGLWSDHSQLFGSNGNKTKENQFKNIYSKEGEEYEVIFNMKENIMSIKQGNRKEILLFKDIKTPVYPFVSIYFKDNSVSLMLYWKGDK